MTCFQNKSKLIAEDHFVEHMSITTNKSLIKWKLYTKDNQGTSLIKYGSLIESSSLQ
jgi:hypothetical protein